MSNLAFKKTIHGYFDIFSEGGHLAKTDGLDSNLLMSLFVDSRADSSEQPVKELQRGWAGNIIVNFDYPGYEIGCKQWLYTEQQKATTDNAEALMDTIKNDGLKWMIDDGLCTDIEVSLNSVDYYQGKYVIDIDIKIDENNSEKKRIVFWENTEFVQD